MSTRHNPLITEERLVYLPPRDQQILRMRFGIGMKQYTQREVAEHYEVSIPTIRKVEKSALRKLVFLASSSKITDPPTPSDQK